MSTDREFWGEFLNTYKLYPCLWDYKSKDYSNKQLRDTAKKDLVEKCKIRYPDADITFVTKKIHGFRCAFRRELNKVIASKKTGGSREGLYTPTLWYYDTLSFIADSEMSKTTECGSTEDSFKVEDESVFEKMAPKKTRQSSEERKLKNKLYIKQKRENEEYREKEKMLDRKRKQEIRADEEYREKEKALDRKRKQELREDKEQREKKRASDRRRKQELRANKEYREKELASNRKRRQEKKADKQLQEKEKVYSEHMQEINLEDDSVIKGDSVRIENQTEKSSGRKRKQEIAGLDLNQVKSTYDLENTQNDFNKFRENVYNNLIRFYFHNLQYMNYSASQLRME